MGNPQDSTVPEDIFVDLFGQVFGLNKVQLLLPQHPARDINGNQRLIDFALKTVREKVAFEIDGLTWHHPAAISVSKFEDDLLRQNSLIHDQWRVFRWTDRQLAEDPETVKEQLACFLESIPGLLELDDFLPMQRGGVVELRDHQGEALEWLQQLRQDSKTIALLNHATGTGKTIVAIEDARRLGGRTLFLAHRKNLVEQNHKQLEQIWPLRSAGIFMGDRRDVSAFNVSASIQSLADHLDAFDPGTFSYVIVDEAHHAVADSYQRVLAYFRPNFLLGLSATPERPDGKSVLAFFRESSHRLSLRRAVELGELVPIRCVRVETNVDLNRVRFNQVQYNRKDLEESVLIPSRDRLIVDTYNTYLPDRKTVVFCVNVRHGENVAKLFREHGVAAMSVSGRMSEKDRTEVLHQFEVGELKVLCACDILNEGWDCPNIEALFMARPTLSKVIYLQQLGRGTRKSPGKESLVVVDFVDNASRYNASLSLHRVVGNPKYRKGGLALAPDELLKAEEALLQNGDKPTATVDIHLWAKDFIEVDLFNWQDAVSNMISLADLELALGTAANFIRRAIERDEVVPDHLLEFGDRKRYYFEDTDERRETIRAQLGIEKINDQSIKDLFVKYCKKMDTSSSYKPVLLNSLLDCVDGSGRAKIDDVANKFRCFYQQRSDEELPIEKDSIRMSRLSELSESDVRSIMLEMPFEKFERRKYLSYHRDVAYIRFEPRLWRQLNAADIQCLREACHRSINKYYERVT